MTATGHRERPAGSPVRAVSLQDFARVLRRQRVRGSRTQSQAATAAGVPFGWYLRLEQSPESLRWTNRDRTFLRRVQRALNMTDLAPSPSASATDSEVPGAPTTGSAAQENLQQSRPLPRARAGGIKADRPEWAQYLTALRVDRDLTVTEAAALFGVTQQTWSGLESGLRRIRGVQRPLAPKDETLRKVEVMFALTDEETQRLHALVARLSTRPPARAWQERLLRARLTAGLTTAQAAALAEVTDSTYRRWEYKCDGSPSATALRRLLPHLGIDGEAAAAFLREVPSDRSAARPPRQPTNPIEQVPAWSAFLTQLRLTAGMHLAQVDTLLGQQSIARRFELGGWKRTDGRLSVPPRVWLDRLARVVNCSEPDRQHLHHLADEERLRLALQGPGPRAAEILCEARRAQNLKASDVDALLPNAPYRWFCYESGDDRALKTLQNPAVLGAILTVLDVCPALAQALTTTAGDAVTPDCC